jgi:hypothetical protein
MFVRHPDSLLEDLEEEGPVMRRSELIEEEEMAERKALDLLLVEEDVQVFAVGEEVMVRLVEDTDDPSGC